MIFDTVRFDLILGAQCSLSACFRAASRVIAMQFAARLIAPEAALARRKLKANNGSSGGTESGRPEVAITPPL